MRFQTEEHGTGFKVILQGEKKKCEFDQASGSFYPSIGNTEDHANWHHKVPIKIRNPGESSDKCSDLFN